MALRALDRGGTLAVAGIWLSDIPALNYADSCSRSAAAQRHGEHPRRRRAVPAAGRTASASAPRPPPIRCLTRRRRWPTSPPADSAGPRSCTTDQCRGGSGKNMLVRAAYSSQPSRLLMCFSRMRAPEPLVSSSVMITGAKMVTTPGQCVGGDQEDPPPHAGVAEVVRVPRVAPQPDVDDLALVAPGRAGTVPSARRRRPRRTRRPPRPRRRSRRATPHRPRARSRRPGSARRSRTPAGPAAGRSSAARTDRGCPAPWPASRRSADPRACRSSADRCAAASRSPHSNGSTSSSQRRSGVAASAERTNTTTATATNSSPQVVSMTLCLPAILATTKVTQQDDAPPPRGPAERAGERRAVEGSSPTLVPAHGRVAGMPLTPSAVGRTARNWSTPIRPSSKLSAPPTRYSRHTRATSSPTQGDERRPSATRRCPASARRCVT